VIRPYRPEDLATVVDIANRAWQPIYDMYLETYGESLFATVIPDRMTCKGAQVESHCQAHPDGILVCEVEGRVVGFVTFRLNERDGVGEIGNNAVDPDCGLKGIGQQMYRAALDCFRARGMAFAKVGTGLDWAHAPARRAYERAGFNISHQNVTYWQELGCT